MGFRRIGVFCEHQFFSCPAASMEMSKPYLQDFSMLLVTESLGEASKVAFKEAGLGARGAVWQQADEKRDCRQARWLGHGYTKNLAFVQYVYCH